jgi:hypothetical protein
MHVGPYDAEPETIARMHEVAREAGLRPRGAHDEIYLATRAGPIPGSSGRSCASRCTDRRTRSEGSLEGATRSKGAAI